MAGLRQSRFWLWPWRKASETAHMTVTPPAIQEFSEKMTELINLERGVAALYYYLPDNTLAQYAQTRCQTLQSQKVIESGVDRELHAKDAAFASWTAVSAAWCSAVWQRDEILATFGYRALDELRAQNELWSVVVDPRAQFFGLATATDEEHRYWLVLIAGQKGQAIGADTATAAR